VRVCVMEHCIVFKYLYSMCVWGSVTGYVCEWECEGICLFGSATWHVCGCECNGANACGRRVQSGHALGFILGVLQRIFRFLPLTLGIRSMLNFLHSFLTPAKSSPSSPGDSVFDSGFFSEHSAVTCVPSGEVFFSAVSAVSPTGSAPTPFSASLTPV